MAVGVPARLTKGGTALAPLDLPAPTGRSSPTTAVGGVLALTNDGPVRGGGTGRTSTSRVVLVASMGVPGLLLLASFLLHYVRRFQSTAGGMTGGLSLLLAPSPGAYVVQVQIVVVAQVVPGQPATLKDP